MVIPSMRYLRAQAAQAAFSVQPIRSLTDGDVLMYELSRVLPDMSEERFSSYTARFDLIDDVEMLLLDAAVTFAGKLPAAFPTSAVSVNVNAGALSCRLASHAVELAKQMTTRLVVELSDDTASEDLEESAAILREGGVVLVLDNVGRGSSDAFRARRLGVRAVKLDPSMLTIDRAHELHELIGQLPPSVRLSATGVDDLEAALLCVSLGINWGQGDVLGPWETPLAA